MLLVSTLFSSFAFANEQSKPSLVALGDSITYGYGLGDPSSPSSDAFPYLIGDGLFEVTNISFMDPSHPLAEEITALSEGILQGVFNNNWANCQYSWDDGSKCLWSI
ncbi:hypothetical protein BTR23_18080 [Alkalihalophilus pseudofirmus]|nr:hypothetical protein BTR23_18080 [Alkalihalophilus pseudofirmus]